MCPTSVEIHMQLLDSDLHLWYLCLCKLKATFDIENQAGSTLGQLQAILQTKTIIDVPVIRTASKPAMPFYSTSETTFRLGAPVFIWSTLKNKPPILYENGGWPLMTIYYGNIGDGQVYHITLHRTEVSWCGGAPNDGVIRQWHPASLVQAASDLETTIHLPRNHGSECVSL